MNPMMVSQHSASGGRPDVAKTLVVAVGPNGFPGAGQIMAQTLRHLSKHGFCVAYVGEKLPFLFSFTDQLGVRFVQPPLVRSGAIGPGAAVPSVDVLQVFSLANAIVSVILDSTTPEDRVVIWGTYLFPYGYAALLASQTIRAYRRSAALWLTPTGSDVWELGPQLHHVATMLLRSVHVSRLITYTAAFAHEINEAFEVNRPFSSVYPILDFSRFSPPCVDARTSMRHRLGIARSAFVITSHSNMRPVKQPQAVLQLARCLALSVPRDIVLLMIGPEIEALRSSIECPSNLRVIWAGIQQHVEHWLHTSDVELNCSMHDSFNLSLAEAMACGLPCVSTDVVGIGPEILKCHGGFLFPRRLLDDDALERTSNISTNPALRYLVSLVLDETLRSQVGARACAHARCIFEPQRAIEEYVKFIDSDT
jgi:glycosyltransferase involved in cell wall biosynthesis